MRTTKLKSKKTRRKPLPRAAAHKLRSVRKVLDGFSAVEVGRRYGDSPRAVAYWVTRFKAKGSAGLHIMPRSGRPTKLTPPQLEKVKAYVEDAHVRSVAVTGSALAQFIKKKLRARLTRRHCLRILAKLGPPLSPP